MQWLQLVGNVITIVGMSVILFVVCFAGLNKKK